LSDEPVAFGCGGSIDGPRDSLTPTAPSLSKEDDMKNKRATVVAACIAFLMMPIIGWAQDGDHDQTHNQPAVTDAAVDFGVLPLATVALGPPPCLQPTVPPAPPAAIGGPTDPCSYALHHLTPEEVTIRKGGQVTFQIHGGGHAMAIYQVSKDTTRNELGQFLCAGTDPATIPTTIPLSHVCNGTTPAGVANADAAHNIADGHENVVIVVSRNVTNVHPDNRVWYEPGRLMSAGGQQFLNGGTIPAGATSNGQLITYRFLKTGRYLVICMNRSHSLNDWMFGFVNVVDDGDDD
jgi:hypothetical protein